MKRFIALGALALCLLSGTAMADKARNIAKVTYSDKTSPDSHKGMTGWLNADYVDCYLRMTESHKLYDGEEISEEQADADLARYQNMLLNDDSGFVPFAEYKKK